MGVPIFAARGNITTRIGLTAVKLGLSPLRRRKGRVERWRGGVGFDIFWVGVSPSVSQ